MKQDFIIFILFVKEALYAEIIKNTHTYTYIPNCKRYRGIYLFVRNDFFSVLASFRDDTFPVFTGFPFFSSSKKVIFEIDANPLRSQNVILWGGGGGNPSRENLRSLRNSFVFKKKSLAPSALVTLLNYFDIWITGCVTDYCVIDYCKKGYFKEKNVCPR